MLTCRRQGPPVGASLRYTPRTIAAQAKLTNSLSSVLITRPYEVVLSGQYQLRNMGLIRL